MKYLVIHFHIYIALYDDNTLMIKINVVKKIHLGLGYTYINQNFCRNFEKFCHCPTSICPISYVFDGINFLGQVMQIRCSE